MTDEPRIVRLAVSHADVARRMFAAMDEAFGEPGEPLGDAYLHGLLARRDFWAMAAIVGDEVVGGVTAHTLPMTRAETSEIFVYDVAVRADHQRRGIGRRLIEALRDAASEEGISLLFVPADDEDAHALDFYRALGGVAAAVTIFTFSPAG